MRRSGTSYLITILSVLALVSMGSLAVYAASPHFKKGGEPTCTASATLLTCSASLAGLGSADVDLSLTAPAEASFNCVNKGGNVSPGQNKVPFTATANAVIPGTEIKNGNLTFSISAPTTTPTATAQDAGCPNGNWTTQLASISFSSPDLTISQGGVELFDCSTTAAVGSTPVTLTCTQP